MLYRRSEREPADRSFHALADPNRRVIVERLSRGPATVSELAQPLRTRRSSELRGLRRERLREHRHCATRRSTLAS
jgi:DNA-binding transcriptional ArsR family regulator